MHPCVRSVTLKPRLMKTYGNTSAPSITSKSSSVMNVSTAPALSTTSRFIRSGSIKTKSLAASSVGAQSFLKRYLYRFKDNFWPVNKLLLCHYNYFNVNETFVVSITNIGIHRLDLAAISSP